MTRPWHSPLWKSGIGRLAGVGNLFGDRQQPFALNFLLCPLAAVAHGLGFFADALFPWPKNKRPGFDPTSHNHSNRQPVHPWSAGSNDEYQAA
ncbi:hypothetical protein AGR7A_Lc180033 [Agrobacterium deltaense NCPPB 1641]|uniref:Uncharacterized protein n=1 Tax=Agrobacterium deltaense NCPPB 1641 TaxID=1183425 RepID=A0A1S7U3F5_9HYPH|nr:hypothetical protein AGR7A_Lc180033 [Agrobacterium deltaense NCPPB 1641]